MQLDVVGYNACGHAGEPAIDAHVTIHFRQVCLNGILQPLQFRLYGSHDGFPWHELLINGILIYTHDPCATGESPWSLFTDGANEHLFEVFDGEHPPYDGNENLPLDQWRHVPGVQP